MSAIASASYEQGQRHAKAGRHAEAISCYQEALTAAPADTRVLFALGNTAKMLGMAKPAEMFFRQVLSIEPERIEALINLSNLLRANGNPAAARVLLDPAVARDPQNAELLMTLGSAHRDLGNSEEAERCYREALAAKPNYASAQANLADMLSQKGAHDEALALYDRALRNDPDNAQAKLNRSISHLLTGNLKQGWRDYAARLKISGKAPVADHGLPAWTGNSLKGKRLLVTAEQGVGDELMFASLIPELAVRAREEGGSIILECDKRLVPLFARSFDGVTVHESAMESVGGIVKAHYGWLKSVGGANLAVEIGTLPRYLRNDISKFPEQHAYLDADEMEVLNLQTALAQAGEGPFIGVCWRSGKLTDGRAGNYAPLKLWAALLRELPGTPVCVQYDATEIETGLLGTMTGKQVLVPEGINQKMELDRACALLSALDVVISAPTAVSWLSAAAGVPTFKILRDVGWTSFGTDHEPFAPSARCIVPDTFGDWENTFAKAKEAISPLL